MNRSRLHLMWIGMVVSTCFVLSDASAQPAIVESLVPHYIQGRNGTNSQRIPCAYWVQIGGLTANATYRYFNQVVRSSDSPTTDGAGNSILASPGGFVRTSSPSLSSAGNYGEFTADANGSFSGWMVTEPTGNARFVPGNCLFFRMMLNDGAGGTTVAARLTTADSIRVLKLDTAAADSAGTGLRAQTLAAPRDFVLLYDNTDGTGRPLAATFVESDGSDNSTGNNYVAFYSDSVNGVDGAFGTIVPNVNGNGVRRVERRSSVGNVIASAQSENGQWPRGANTANPAGGATPIVLTTADVPLSESSVDWQGAAGPPVRFQLLAPYPNPFNALVSIRFDLPLAQHVLLEIHDVTGRLVVTLVDSKFPAGQHEFRWDGAGISSGIYFVAMNAGGFAATRRLVLLK